MLVISYNNCIFIADDESVFEACEVSKTGERRDSMSRLAKLHVSVAVLLDTFLPNSIVKI